MLHRLCAVCGCTPVVGRPSLAARRSPLVACRLSPVACRLSPVACRLSPVACRLPPAPCRLQAWAARRAGVQAATRYPSAAAVSGSVAPPSTTIVCPVM
ncbi:hypothetical protein FKO42_33385 [Burkholderia pseudomallei]|nr:hypothetical protein FKO42_33385 [Burkholderia pseudomallei]